MHRFFLPPEQCREASLFLTGREAHHARDVVRVRHRERVAVVDGTGHEFQCEVQEYARDKVRLVVVEKLFHPALPSQVTLLQAVPKGRTMEAIIQKATELGASRIVPLLSERVVAQLDDQDARHKAAKWRLVAMEAIKQCGSAWLPEVEAPVTPSRFLARGESFELPLIASLESSSRPLREYLRTFHAKHGRMPRSVCVWVGPEGDFTPAETEAIKSHGVVPITLGRLILRAETATIYCLSVLNYELQPPAARDYSVS
ncbi:MAG: RsmE family RNA methyltransferase [Verrucomicrobiota bacterium]|jgi:16S rRNA (uracil1498-N3)-methyltransferase